MPKVTPILPEDAWKIIEYANTDALTTDLLRSLCTAIIDVSQEVQYLRSRVIELERQIPEGREEEMQYPQEVANA